MTQDDAGSAPMLGSQADDCGARTAPPLAAWAVEHGGDIVYVAIRAHDAQDWAGGGPVDVVPLYREHPRLSAAEREAVERAADWLDRWQKTHGYHSAESGDLATLRGLLERTK